MSKDNLLSAYSDTPSFALWDGEHAILRLTGKVDRNFIKLDSKGKEQTYLGLECILIEHSNENYNHRHDTTCIFRIGKEFSYWNRIHVSEMGKRRTGGFKS